jgi:hypothetical protein
MCCELSFGLNLIILCYRYVKENVLHIMKIVRNVEMIYKDNN